jgi:hypothetical protein
MGCATLDVRDGRGVRVRARVRVTEEMKSTPMAAEMTYLALLLSYRCAAVSCVQSRAKRIKSPAKSEGPCAQLLEQPGVL